MRLLASAFCLVICGSAAGAIDCARGLTATEKVSRMNRALTPVLMMVGARLRCLSRDEVAGWAKSATADQRDVGLVDQLSPEDRALGIYESFEGWIRFSSSNLVGPYSAHNRPIMLRLTLAVSLVEELIERWAEDLRAVPSFRSEIELMRLESATGEDLVFLLKLAGQTVLQGLAALTASPLPGLEAAELLSRVTRGPGCRPSIINQYALALTAGQLGSNGDLIYIADALVLDDGIPRFSPKCRALMKAGRAQFDPFTADVGEFGKGCPVAHTLIGFEQTGLQGFVDGVTHVYDLLMSLPPEC